MHAPQERMARGVAATAAVEWQLVVLAFDQVGMIVNGSIVVIALAIFAFVNTHAPGFLALAAGTIVVLAGRIALERAFERRAPGDRRTLLWRRRFIIGAWAMAGLWGASVLIIRFNDYPAVQLLVICTNIVLIMGGAARNAACAPAARGQVVIGMLPMLALCVTRFDAQSLTFAVFILTYVLAAFAMVRELNGATRRLLRLNEQNAALIEEVQRNASDLALANGRLEAAATTDSLTGIPNRRRFDAVLSDETARAQRDSTDVSLLLFDIDRFKAYNDYFGHQAGDACLLRVAQALDSALRRPADLVARYGGEEFVAVLPQTSEAAAVTLAKRMRASIERLAIPNPGSASGRVTVSVGVASVSAGRYRRPEQFFAAADAALYAAKDAGRNCVRVEPCGPCNAGAETVGAVLR